MVFVPVANLAQTILVLVPMPKEECEFMLCGACTDKIYAKPVSDRKCPECRCVMIVLLYIVLGKPSTPSLKRIFKV